MASLIATMGALVSAFWVRTYSASGNCSWIARVSAHLTASPSRWPRWSGRTMVAHWSTPGSSLSEAPVTTLE